MLRDKEGYDLYNHKRKQMKCVVVLVPSLQDFACAHYIKQRAFHLLGLNRSNYRITTECRLHSNKVSSITLNETMNKNK